MSPTIRHKANTNIFTVQRAKDRRAKDRRQKFHFCRLPFDVRPRNVTLNLSNAVFFLAAQFQAKKVNCRLAVEFNSMIVAVFKKAFV